MTCRRHSNSANTKLRCYNIARLRNYLCRSIIILFAYLNTLPRLWTARLRAVLLRIFDHTKSQDTATDESDEQDYTSYDTSDDSTPSPDWNNILLARNNSSLPPERETLTEPEMGGSIFDSTTISTTSNQEHSDVLVPGVDYIGRRGNEVNCGKWWANTPSSRHKLRKPIFAYQQYQRYYLCQR